MRECAVRTSPTAANTESSSAAPARALDDGVRTSPTAALDDGVRTSPAAALDDGVRTSPTAALDDCVDRTLIRERLAMTPAERSRRGVEEARALLVLMRARPRPFVR
jgi:hypothetical protein